MAEVLQRLRKILSAPCCRHWAALLLSLETALELKNIPNHVPIWQINLPSSSLSSTTSHMLGCPLKKDCLSRWLFNLNHCCIHHPGKSDQAKSKFHALVEERFHQVKYIMCHSWSNTHQNGLIWLLIRKGESWERSRKPDADPCAARRDPKTMLHLKKFLTFYNNNFQTHSKVEKIVK